MGLDRTYHGVKDVGDYMVLQLLTRDYIVLFRSLMVRVIDESVEGTQSVKVQQISIISLRGIKEGVV